MRRSRLRISSEAITCMSDDTESADVASEVTAPFFSGGCPAFAAACWVVPMTAWSHE